MFGFSCVKWYASQCRGCFVFTLTICDNFFLSQLAFWFVRVEVSNGFKHNTKWTTATYLCIKVKIYRITQRSHDTGPVYRYFLTSLVSRGCPASHKHDLLTAGTPEVQRMLWTVIHCHLLCILVHLKQQTHQTSAFSLYIAHAENHHPNPFKWYRFVLCEPKGLKYRAGARGTLPYSTFHLTSAKCFPKMSNYSFKFTEERRCTCLFQKKQHFFLDAEAAWSGLCGITM